MAVLLTARSLLRRRRRWRVGDPARWPPDFAATVVVLVVGDFDLEVVVGPGWSSDDDRLGLRSAGGRGNCPSTAFAPVSGLTVHQTKSRCISTCQQLSTLMHAVWPPCLQRIVPRREELSRSPDFHGYRWAGRVRPRRARRRLRCADFHRDRPAQDEPSAAAPPTTPAAAARNAPASPVYRPASKDRLETVRRQQRQPQEPTACTLLPFSESG